MSADESAGSNEGNAETESPSRGSEPGGLTIRPSPKTRTLGGGTSIELGLLLKVLIPAITLLLGGAFGAGKWMANHALVQENRSMQDALRQGLAPIIESLDVPDKTVDEILESKSRAGHADSELSIYLNQRGLNIYRAEKSRATAMANSFHRDEVQRALKWFEKAEKLDPQAPWPHWNSACMFGLLGDANGAVRRLYQLEGALPPGGRVQFEEKLSSKETDFCPIQEERVFKDHLRTVWRIERRVTCPAPAIHTE